MGRKGERVENDEIFARIAADVQQFPYGKPPIIAMTNELFCRLSPVAYVRKQPYLHTELFGCEIRCVANRGLWWIVGYMRDLEEEAEAT